MLNILKRMRPIEWVQAAVILVLSILQVWLDLKFPDFMAGITRLLQDPGSHTQEILIAGGYMLLCALGSLLCVIMISFYASRTAASLSMRLRGMVFTKIGTFSMEEVSSFSASSLITRCTNDITQIQMFFMSGLQMLLKVPILAAGGIIKIAGMAAEWTLTTALALVFMLIVVVCVMKVVLPIFKEMQSLVDNMNLNVRENLAGRYVIRAFNAESYQEGKFNGSNEAFTRADQATNRAMAAMSPAMSIGNNGVILAIYCIGAYLISSADKADALLIFSSMVVFSAYAAQVMTAVKFITKVLPRWPRASVSARRVNEVLETEATVRDGQRSDGIEGVIGEVTFENVSFRYPGAANDILEDISFTAKHGETIAFVGSTGSGKTTLINLIPRLYDVTNGKVLVDGIDVRDYNCKALNNKIGYVPQKSILFKGTVDSNVAFGDNGRGGYAQEDISKALQIAQAQEFVGDLDGGGSAPVSQGGTTFSGGQRQRLSIARAICRDPEILILDDAYASLDYKTDRALRDGLKKETAGITKLIVAQRISTIMDADRIIVLDEGKIVGQGTHEELLHSCRVYREIAESQLSEEEMAS